MIGMIEVLAAVGATDSTRKTESVWVFQSPTVESLWICSDRDWIQLYAGVR